MEFGLDRQKSLFFFFHYLYSAYNSTLGFGEGEGVYNNTNQGFKF